MRFGFTASQRRQLVWASVTLLLMAVSYWGGKQRHRLNRASVSPVAQDAPSSLSSTEFDYLQWTLDRSAPRPDFGGWSAEDFAQWQAAQREVFTRKLVFPYSGEIEVLAVGEGLSRGDYHEQEFWVSVGQRRVFRFYKLRPHQVARQAPAIVTFMGHGNIRQLLELEGSYQRAAAKVFAEEGYVVFVMDNVAMGPGDPKEAHRQLDSMLSLAGYGWYSLLFAHQRMLLDVVFDDPEVDADAVGVAGVSTGGLLALTAAALEPRVKAASVHGIFASLADSFARDGRLHCDCGTIDGALPNFDLPRLALLVVPRALHINNNRADTFPPADAQRALQLIEPVFVNFGGVTPRFTSPEGRHSFALPEAMTFFEASL